MGISVKSIEKDKKNINTVKQHKYKVLKQIYKIMTYKMMDIMFIIKL